MFGSMQNTQQEDITKIKALMENKLFGNDLIRQTHRFRRNQYEALRRLGRMTDIPINVLVRYAVDELIKSQVELEQPTPKKRTSD